MSSNLKKLCDDYLNGKNNENSITSLIQFIKKNEKKQNELYLNLTEKGIFKLMIDLKHDNIIIRKKSFKLLIDLLYNNEILQNIFCEKFNFNPMGNVICINWFPQVLNDVINIDPLLINEIKESQLSHSKSKYWMWPINNRYNDLIIPDPNKYLIGFVFNNKNCMNYSFNIFKDIGRLSHEKLLEITEFLEKEEEKSSGSSYRKEFPLDTKENLKEEEKSINLNNIPVTAMKHSKKNTNTEIPLADNMIKRKLNLETIKKNSNVSKSTGKK